jgi:hypothetical protein
MASSKPMLTGVMNVPATSRSAVSYRNSRPGGAGLAL